MTDPTQCDVSACGKAARDRLADPAMGQTAYLQVCSEHRKAFVPYAGNVNDAIAKGDTSHARKLIARFLRREAP